MRRSKLDEFGADYGLRIRSIDDRVMRVERSLIEELLRLNARVIRLEMDALPKCPTCHQPTTSVAGTEQETP